MYHVSLKYKRHSIENRQRGGGTLIHVCCAHTDPPTANKSLNKKSQSANKSLKNKATSLSRAVSAGFLYNSEKKALKPHTGS